MLRLFIGDHETKCHVMLDLFVPYHAWATCGCAVCGWFRWHGHTHTCYSRPEVADIPQIPNISWQPLHVYAGGFKY